MASWLPLGIGMKSFDSLSDPTLVQWVRVPPGARQCPASCDKSMQAVPGGWRNWYHWMAPMLSWPKSNRTPLGHYVFGPSNATRLHLRLSRSSVMPKWCPSSRNIQCCQVCGFPMELSNFNTVTTVVLMSAGWSDSKNLIFIPWNANLTREHVWASFE